MSLELDYKVLFYELAEDVSKIANEERSEPLKQILSDMFVKMGIPSGVNKYSGELEYGHGEYTARKYTQ